MVWVPQAQISIIYAAFVFFFLKNSVPSWLVAIQNPQFAKKKYIVLAGILIPGWTEQSRRIPGVGLEQQRFNPTVLISRSLCMADQHSHGMVTV